MNNSEFCHLHLHNEYSKLDGVGTCKNYVKRAKEIGFKYLALTNHANVDGCIKFQYECEKNDIIPIIGCEMYIVSDLTKKEKGDVRGHILLLVKNQIGWKNLLNLLTIANIDGFYYRPRIDYETLYSHLEGLIISTACSSSFLNLNNGIEFFEDLIREIPDDLYLELMLLDFQRQVDMNKLVLDLHNKYKIPIILTNDCHYPNRGDDDAHEVLLAIQTKAKWNDPNRWKFETKDLYLKNINEIVVTASRKHQYINYNYIDAAMKNTLLIAEKCSEFRIKKSKVTLPFIAVEENIDEYTLLCKMCNESFDKLITNDVHKYRTRLNYELLVIQERGFVRYFLIVEELVRWCRNNNVQLGAGRGSCAGSLISYLLRITTADPIKYGLVFERFISQDRTKLPDIDLDFEDERRFAVKQHLEELYGKFHVANVSTFLQMKDRMVLRDVARVFEVPQNEVDVLAKIIPEYTFENTKVSGLDNVINTTDIGKNFNIKYPHVVNIAKKLNGQVRGIGQHAAGVVISDVDFRKSYQCNIVSRGDATIINWDKYDAEFTGLLKLDVLGLSNLSMIKKAKQLIKTNYDIDIEFENINLNDKKVLDEFANGECIGIFQFNTSGLRNLCRELRADSFELLAQITAMYRPASLHSGMVDEFKQRRMMNDRSSYLTNDKVLNEILIPTYGILIYQEQTMLIANKIANMSLSDAEIFRRALSTDDQKRIDEQKDKFIEGCIKHSRYHRNDAEKLFNMLSSYSGYGFNRSHSVCYTILSFWNMYLKAYYPAEFLCASLTTAAEDKITELISDANKRNLLIMTPKIGISMAKEYVVKNNIIYMPFIVIKGIGDKMSSQLEEFSKNKGGFFSSNLNTKFKNICDKIFAFDNNMFFHNKNIIPAFYLKGLDYRLYKTKNIKFGE